MNAKPILLVVSPYYQAIGEMLISGASSMIYGAEHTAEMIAVPGALEIPAAIAMAAQRDNYAAFVALGCVIRGKTPHFDIVAHESARALQQLAVTKQIAIGNGILTVETMAQALERADPAKGNKGGGAAQAALRMLQIRHLFGLDHS